MPDREWYLSGTVHTGNVRWMLSTGYPPVVHNQSGCTGLAGGAVTDGPSTRGTRSLPRDAGDRRWCCRFVHGYGAGRTRSRH